MKKKDILSFSSPCGIYCVACVNFTEKLTCKGCRNDPRHEQCEIYECCVKQGGKLFCFECGEFPCERIKEFVDYHPGKKFAHYRHIAIKNLYAIKDQGLEIWADSMENFIRQGSYIVTCNNDGDDVIIKPCACISWD